MQPIPILVHYCNTCTHSARVPFTASVFSQNHYCSHCGAISEGINIQAKQEAEGNMEQDELARLFSANLTLSQHGQHAPLPDKPRGFAPRPVQQPQEQAPVPSQIVYASQHYTHSYHVVPEREVAATTQILASELQTILIRNSIDPSLLFPSQVDLFQNADDDQRLRLLELWRISPPQGGQGIPGSVDYNTSRQLYDWPPTSLAQEESMAKLRYERMLQEHAQYEEIQQHEQQLEQSMGLGGDAHASSPDNAEPYIVSGYDMLAKREYEQSIQAAANPLRESTKYNLATDPVYSHGGANNGLWEKQVGTIMDLENQYGAFAQARDRDVQPFHGDDEMVM